MKTEVLRMEHVTRAHGGVKILDDFKLNIYKGEVLGMVGLSGTGKTAISNILAGLEPIDSGRVYFNEQLISNINRSTMKRLNIFTIYHGTRLVPQISIAENIFVIKDNSIRKILINPKALNHQAQLLLDEVGIDLPPESLAGELSLAEQHLVELAKAIASSARLIVLDDITDSYTFREINKLKEIINRLKYKGIAFLFESHKPDELLDFADRITILRDGRNVKTFYKGEYDKDAMLSFLVGSEFREGFDRENTKTDEVILEVDNLCTDEINNISFKLHKGEILGVFDLENKANIEMYNLLSGAVQPTSGEMFLNNCRLTIKNISKAVRDGIGLIPEGAINTTLFKNMNYAENLSFLIMKKKSNSFMYINKRIINFISREYRKQVNIDEDEVNNRLESFNVYTRQKIMLYRWLIYRPKILVFANFGAMLDIITKEITYNLINEAAKSGTGIIIATSDLSEAANICDRIIVISGDKVKGEYTKNEILRLNVHELH